MVWKSLGIENDTLIRDEFLLPDFKDERNGFVFYRLSRPLPLIDSFYVGWFQVSLLPDLKMDVGFDLNDTANVNLWYNVDGTWQQSGLPGALMMRPVLGKQIPFGVGIEDVSPGDDYSIFPNPANDMIYVRGGSENLKLEVLDNSGRILRVENGQSSMDIRQLPAGFYLLRITELRNNKSSIKKFIKAN